MALQFLAELGLAPENPGVYNGAWGGSGSLLTSTSPTTGRPIATIRQATVEEYESCISAMIAAQEAWQLVRMALVESVQLLAVRFVFVCTVFPVRLHSCLLPSVVRLFVKLVMPCARSVKRWVTWCPLKWARSFRKALAKSKSSSTFAIWRWV